MRKPARDHSDEVFKAILIGFVGLVIAAAFLWRAYKPEPLAATKRADLPTSASPSHTTFSEPQSVAAEPQAAPAPALPLPSRPAGPSASDVSRYNSLRDYCYRMTQMNAAGEYPAFQQAACGDFARFAQSKGWDTGGLPEVRVKQAEAPRVAQRSSAKKAQSNQSPAQCALLEQQKQAINSRMRQLYGNQEGERLRESLRQINAAMWDLNCRNH